MSAPVTTPAGVAPGGDATASPGGAAVISLRGVGVTLGGRPIVSDVSFALLPGEVTGLIGPNGAGKTTVMRVVLGLLRPSSGTLGRLPSVLRPGGLGYVPQQVELDADLPLRARDVVGLGLDGHRLGIPLPSRRKRAIVEEMLEQVGAASFADDRIGSLSGGQRQRVLLAQALVGRPAAVVLDEPLANLDVRSEQEVAGLLGRVASDHGVAVLVSAHDVNPVLGVMSQIVYLAEGHAACGPTEEVVRTEVLSRLYGHHVDVLRVHGRILVVPARHGTADDAEDPARPPGADAGVEQVR